MSIQSHGHEHEFEPQYGLPEALPADETILWQGSPSFGQMAVRVFHVRKAAIYFCVLLALRAANLLADGKDLGDTLVALLLPAGLAVLALAALATLAWLNARTAVYTLTNKRVVMRVGVVLTLTFNLPLRAIAAAATRPQSGTTGDIVISLAGSDRIAWMQLWPHVRPWHITRPEPMLRAVPNAAHVAALLAQAWAAATGAQVSAAATAGIQPSLNPAFNTKTSPAPAAVNAGGPWQASPT